MTRLTRWFVLASLCAPSGVLEAQATKVSLRDALSEADRSAFVTRAAARASGIRRARELATLRGILPSVHVEAGAVRTTDPMGAFGATLRRREVSPESFDPRRLNFPDAVSSYQGGVVIEQPLLNPDAWAARAAARIATNASRASLEWTRVAARADVLRAYYGVALADEQVRTLAAGVRAARAHVSQAEAMVRGGLATKSDALLASVRAADIESRLAEATGAAATASRQLGVALGRDGSAEVDVLTRALPASARIRALVADDTLPRSLQPRADLEAATSDLAAARAELTRAKSALLPRVNTFARVDWYSATRPYAGNDSWTVGIVASWSLFGGASELADIRATAAQAELARAGAEGTEARARLEVEQSRIALAVALARLALAERALTQSAEAHRIVARKYEGGLATVVELLDAQAAETETALTFAEARFTAIAAAAERRRATGGDPASLATLEDSTVLTEAATPGMKR